MTIAVAVPDSVLGPAAIDAAIAEARVLDTDLRVLPLGVVSSFDDSVFAASGVPYVVVARAGRGDRDPAEAVLDDLDEHPEVTRLVIGMRKRSRVSKAIIGSISQRLLLDSPVPVLAVKG